MELYWVFLLLGSYFHLRIVIHPWCQHPWCLCMCPFGSIIQASFRLTLGLAWSTAAWQQMGWLLDIEELFYPKEQHESNEHSLFSQFRPHKSTAHYQTKKKPKKKKTTAQLEEFQSPERSPTESLTFGGQPYVLLPSSLFSTPLPHPCITGLSGGLLCLCLCAYTSRGPIPASPWGLSLSLVLSPSIDFESKARRVPLTHFSLRCHFACSAVPKLNKMDSGMMWKRKQKTWGCWWEQSGKSDKSLSHLDVKRGKLQSRTWKPLSPLYPFTYLWGISSPWICVFMPTQVEKETGKKCNRSHRSQSWRSLKLKTYFGSVFTLLLPWLIFDPESFIFSMKLSIVWTLHHML